MAQIFVVVRRRAGAWRHDVSLEQQAKWHDHAHFMDDLYERGIALLVGPMEGTNEAPIIMRAESPAEITAVLEKDPWTVMGMLETTRIARWELRLGAL